jgi:acetyl-CoA carboxylase biotin carboxylase subunit
MVTGIDLIKSQIAIASGEPLTMTQDQIHSRGVAIECRINAENPEKNFQPCPGTIENIFVPGGPGVRFDSHVHAGYIVQPYYDSLIGKLIVHQQTRGEAIQCMLRCLDELNIRGINTTVQMHSEILQHADFIEGEVNTTWVERTFFS